MSNYTPQATTPTDEKSTDTDVVVADTHEDAKGNDNENLNDEYVILKNTGEETIEVTDWTVSDEASHEYEFPGFTLDAGASVTLYTGDGTETDSKLYWGENGAVWNSNGDTVTLEDDSGETVDAYAH